MKFKFKSNIWERNKSSNIYLGLTEHNQELRERIFHLILIFILLIVFWLVEGKSLTQFFQAAIPQVRFFQPSPNDYFFLTLKLAISISIILEIPLIVLYIICYLFPALLSREQLAFLSLTVLAIFLFLTGSLYAYKVVVPLALKFFFLYTQDVLEPLWAFTDYIEFLSVIYIGCIISFQIPTLQILLGFFGICTSKNCFNWLRYVLVASTILGAILTPSTDPLTQLIFSVVLLFLYTIGAIVLLFLEKFRILY
uniref:Sec-independent protein translocase component TatC n=1 Tax=Eustigmatophyceae sp. Mont 10/10-1w TaxID=2506145 RepID=A0A451FMT1_9STRA|nr:Sec-independent protein translocase component TatC [Eustigmatophyceae sp. Mont 10/10-1w]QAA11724.1 Sec-independent protein translocase component TatC [Eustigmatophyceae sp. Mont 10/10-1w]